MCPTIKISSTITIIINKIIFNIFKFLSINNESNKAEKMNHKHYKEENFALYIFEKVTHKRKPKEST